jgi:hypothetical protein
MFIKYKMKSTYANYASFGKNQLTDENDPLTFCLVDTMDKNFQHAPNGKSYGPQASICQDYMAERCAKKWDGFCEYFYRENQDRNIYNLNDSIGNKLLRKTAEQRFCSFDNCSLGSVKFDPLNPASPNVTIRQGACIPVCRVDPSTIDNDPVMNRLLENPTVAPDLLLNILNTAEREGVDLSKTKVGQLRK